MQTAINFVLNNKEALGIAAILKGTAGCLPGCDE